jgi:hypothetical protein
VSIASWRHKYKSDRNAGTEEYDAKSRAIRAFKEKPWNGSDGHIHFGFGGLASDPTPERSDWMQ